MGRQPQKESSSRAKGLIKPIQMPSIPFERHTAERPDIRNAFRTLISALGIFSKHFVAEVKEVFPSLPLYFSLSRF